MFSKSDQNFYKFSIIFEKYLPAHEISEISRKFNQTSINIFQEVHKKFKFFQIFFAIISRFP